ncbi:hypothetical protein [Paenibacillus sedimenti]|uniref:DUF5666 domain-containing protein n=1 Tax=Paenibacillus sedimenti TaxID=2770274 RepID=A0A926KSB8_9BACL|nr:hypothetical protein [Paenibacillus sedimenti]MBD0383194.1 hypothetical protein [Paenibacillus sedimenti]
MNKKLRITILAITIVLLLFGGWTAYASTSASSQVSTAVKGTFKSVDSAGNKVTVTTDSGDQTIPLAKSVWVYRNEQKAQLSDLKAGDNIELILNNKQQAAYVKALSEDGTVPETQQPAQVSPAPSSGDEASTGTVPTAPAGSAPAASNPPQAPAPQANEVYPGLDGIDLKIDGKHFKLHIKQEPGSNGGKYYDLHMKPEGAGMVHLKGDEAAAWIQQLLASVDLKSLNAEQQLLKELADHYDLDASKLNIQMKSEWKQTAAYSKHDDDDDDDDDKDEDRDDSQERERKDRDKKDEKTEKHENNKKNDKERGNKHDD